MTIIPAMPTGRPTAMPRPRVLSSRKAVAMLLIVRRGFVPTTQRRAPTSALTGCDTPALNRVVQSYVEIVDDQIRRRDAITAA